MARDDSLLYTGQTSASFASPKEDELKAKQAADKQERLDKQHKLKPAADIVLTLIEKHKKASMYVENIVTDEHLTDAKAGEILRSQRLVHRFLMQFEQEIKIALRESR